MTSIAQMNGPRHAGSAAAVIAVLPLGTPQLPAHINTPTVARRPLVYGTSSGGEALGNARVKVDFAGAIVTTGS
jgi:hypothetical protein